MRTSLAIALSLPLGAMLFCAPSLAHAQEEEPLPKPRPVPADTRAGHPTVALQLGWQRIFGVAQTGLYQSSYASWGAAPGLQIAYPFSRHFAVEAFGSYASFKNHSDDCSTCTARTYSFGLGAVYHLVDGIPFDPWFSAGVAYRATRLADTSYHLDYTGMDVIRWSMGMDYYPAPYIGFGPFTDLSYGRYLTRTPTGPDWTPGYAGTIRTFETGMRVVFRLLPVVQNETTREERAVRETCRGP
jgi:hypothetical protein